MISLVFVLLYFIYELSELDLRNPMYMYLKEALINILCLLSQDHRYYWFIELNCSEVFYSH